MPSICLQYGLGVALGGFGVARADSFSILRILTPVSHPQSVEARWGARTVSGGCDPQVRVFDRLSAVPSLTNEKTASQTAFRPDLAAGVAQNRHWRAPRKIQIGRASCRGRGK